MKFALMTLTAAMVLSGSCLAQTNPGTAPGSKSSASNNSASNSQSGQQQSIANKIKADLQSAGFTDVHVVAESFAVTAKSKDGNPVYMTFGPSGMSAVETVGTISNPASGSTSSGASNSPAKNH